MSAGHTPGPWRVIIDDDGNPLSGRPGVFASDELDCGIVHWDGFVQEYWRSARGDKEITANARLIAAAPELLGALEEALGLRLVGTNNPNIGDDQILPVEVTMGELRRARAAIAKARGDT